MAADSTFLITKEEPEYSSKLERLHELLADLVAEPSRKIVLFSEWKTMLDRIEKKLASSGVSGSASMVACLKSIAQELFMSSKRIRLPFDHDDQRG